LDTCRCWCKYLIIDALSACLWRNIEDITCLGNAISCILVKVVIINARCTLIIDKVEWRSIALCLNRNTRIGNKLLSRQTLIARLSWLDLTICYILDTDVIIQCLSWHAYYAVWGCLSDRGLVKLWTPCSNASYDSLIWQRVEIETSSTETLESELLDIKWTQWLSEHNIILIINSIEWIVICLLAKLIWSQWIECSPCTDSAQGLSVCDCSELAGEINKNAVRVATDDRRCSPYRIALHSLYPVIKIKSKVIVCWDGVGHVETWQCSQ